MPFKRSSCLASVLLVLSFTFESAGAATNVVNCPSTDICIDSMMTEAKAGNIPAQVILAGKLIKFAVPSIENSTGRPNRGGESIAVGDIDLSLTTLLKNAQSDYAFIPDYRRALALAYVKSNQLTLAEQELKKAITGSPTHAAFWVDLGFVFGMQGRQEQAISALMVADLWADDSAKLRAAYEKASTAAPVTGMGLIYLAAIERLTANDGLSKQADTSLPAIPVFDKTNKERPYASIEFSGCSLPEWPRSSLRYEEIGTVTLAFLVDPEGKLLRAKKMESSGYVELDNAALIGVAQCKFKPLRVDGQAVTSWAAIQYVWKLE